MFLSTKWLAAPVLAASSFLFAADAPNASAGHGVFSRGGFSISIGSGGYAPRYGYGSVYTPRYGSLYGHGYGYRAPSRYRSGFGDRGFHYDYYPPTLQRHGNHYDYVPGHYHGHRGGHHH